METIIFIHGANSTRQSFSYLTQLMNPFNHEFYEYETGTPIEEIVANLVTLIGNRRVILVGHSLGGIIATLASQQIPEKVIKLITLSTPFLGSKSADYLKWVIPHYLLFRQISTKNPILKRLKETGATVPTLNFATTGVTTPLFGMKPNDGVITLRSQLGLERAKNIEIRLNHFEVLLSNYVASEINSFLMDNQ